MIDSSSVDCQHEFRSTLINLVLKHLSYCQRTLGEHQRISRPILHRCLCAHVTQASAHSCLFCTSICVNCIGQETIPSISSVLVLFRYSADGWKKSMEEQEKDIQSSYITRPTVLLSICWINGKLARFASLSIYVKPRCRFFACARLLMQEAKRERTRARESGGEIPTAWDINSFRFVPRVSTMSSPRTIHLERDATDRPWGFRLQGSIRSSRQNRFSSIVVFVCV